jgi:uncharacterized protein YbjT (DUF2867 family)
MANTILVTGASGKVGNEAVAALLSKGYSVRAVSRHPQQIPGRPSVQPVIMDYLNPASVDKALDGVEAALLIAPPLDSDAPAKLTHFLSVASRKPGFHIVFISAFGVDHSEQAPLRVIEQMIFKSGVNYTILRPNFFMENFTGGSMAESIKTKGVIALAADSAKTAFIAAADIAAVAASAFADKLFGKEFNLTGPDALDHHEVANLIAGALGKKISYIAVPEEELNKGMRAAGLPEPVISYLGMLYGAVRAGYMATVTDDVQRTIGRAPRSFAEFARLNVNAWR